MNYQRLYTDRLVLRRLLRSDWEMLSYLRSDPDINQFVKRSSAKTKEKAFEFIDMINDSFDSSKSYYWVITVKDIDDMIGSISLHSFNEDRTIGEVGYDLSPVFQKKGIMDESLKAVINFGFENLKLDAITAYTQWNNPSSVKLLNRNGFVLNEGMVDETNEDNRIFQLNR